MIDRGMASKVPVGQFRELAGTVVRCLPDDDGDLAQSWIDNPEFLRRALRAIGTLSSLDPTTAPAVPTRSWREEGGVIYLQVTSDGTTGPQWITRLESKGFRVSGYTKQVLRSPDFKPTNGVTTEIAVLKGMLFTDQDRIMRKIRAEADRRKFVKPNAEVACLIREKFTDEEIEAMGLWGIVAMHEPIKDSDGDPDLLYAYRDGDGCWLGAGWDRPGRRWARDDGFAFALPQVGS